MRAADLAALGYRVEHGRAVRVRVGSGQPQGDENTAAASGASTALPRRSEKAEMHDADRMAEALGFRSVHFSQSRASRQTPGIPDRLFLHPATGVSVWWEAKAEKGRVSVAQEQMHDDLRACGHVVVVGTASVMIRAMQEILHTGKAPTEGTR